MSLTIELPPEKEAALKSKAEAAGLSPHDYAVQALSEVLAKDSDVSGEDRPIWEAIVANMADVPQEELDQLPRDGAANVDHYLYGHPKR